MLRLGYYLKFCKICIEGWEVEMVGGSFEKGRSVEGCGDWDVVFLLGFVWNVDRDVVMGNSCSVYGVIFEEWFWGVEVVFCDNICVGIVEWFCDWD